MRLNFNELKPGDNVYTLNLSNGIPACVEINANEYDVKGFKKYLKQENLLGKLHNTEKGPIDDIRYIDYVKNFDYITITWYLPFIVTAIKERWPVYIIREEYRYGKSDKYLDTSFITKVYYDSSNKCWKIRTQSNDKYIITCHKASTSLGLTIFFDRDNAVDKLESLKGGIN